MAKKLYKLTKSKIHNIGVVAAVNLKKGDNVIEYIGEKISKKEGDRRSEIHIEEAEKNPDLGEVYVFELNDKYDIDGSVDYNDAKYINHSCNPNCESDIVNDRIWVKAIRDIKKGEELTYDYSYDLDEFDEYPCRCGDVKCFGYILDGDLWEKGKKILEKKNLKK